MSSDFVGLDQLWEMRGATHLAASRVQAQIAWKPEPEPQFSQCRA
jgi:hypothetical protein